MSTDQKGGLPPDPSVSTGTGLTPTAGLVQPVAALSRRGFLRGAALVGGGAVAAGLAACAPAAAPAWTYGPSAPAAGASGPPTSSSPSPSPQASMNHGASPSPEASTTPAPSPSASPGLAEHDLKAKTAVQRFLDGEWDTLPRPNVPLEPDIDGDVKVFRLTIDEIKHRIDAQKPPLDALGFNGV